MIFIMVMVRVVTVMMAAMGMVAVLQYIGGDGDGHGAIMAAMQEGTSKSSGC